MATTGPNSTRIDGITSWLTADADVQFALLFGSRAAGVARPDSDHDVAVYLDDRLDADQRHGWLALPTPR